MHCPRRRRAAHAEDVAAGAPHDEVEVLRRAWFAPRIRAEPVARPATFAISVHAAGSDAMRIILGHLVRPAVRLVRLVLARGRLGHVAVAADDACGACELNCSRARLALSDECTPDIGCLPSRARLLMALHKLRSKRVCAPAVQKQGCLRRWRVTWHAERNQRNFIHSRACAAALVLFVMLCVCCESTESAGNHADFRTFIWNGPDAACGRVQIKPDRLSTRR